MSDKKQIAKNKVDSIVDNMNLHGKTFSSKSSAEERSAYKKWLKAKFYEAIDNTEDDSDEIVIQHIALAAASGYISDHQGQVIGQLLKENPLSHPLDGVGVDASVIRQSEKKKLCPTEKEENLKSTQQAFPNKAPGNASSTSGYYLGKGANENSNEICNVLKDICNIANQLSRCAEVTQSCQVKATMVGASRGAFIAAEASKKAEKDKDLKDVPIDLALIAPTTNYAIDESWMNDRELGANVKNVLFIDSRDDTSLRFRTAPEKEFDFSNVQSLTVYRSQGDHMQQIRLPRPNSNDDQNGKKNLLVTKSFLKLADRSNFDQLKKNIIQLEKEEATEEATENANQLTSSNKEIENSKKLDGQQTAVNATSKSTVTSGTHDASMSSSSDIINSITTNKEHRSAADNTLTKEDGINTPTAGNDSICSRLQHQNCEDLAQQYLKKQLKKYQNKTSINSTNLYKDPVKAAIGKNTCKEMLEALKNMEHDFNGSLSTKKGNLYNILTKFKEKYKEYQDDVDEIVNKHYKNGAYDYLCNELKKYKGSKKISSAFFDFTESRNYREGIDDALIGNNCQQILQRLAKMDGDPDGSLTRYNDKGLHKILTKFKEKYPEYQDSVQAVFNSHYERYGQSTKYDNHSLAHTADQFRSMPWFTPNLMGY